MNEENSLSSQQSAPEPSAPEQQESMLQRIAVTWRASRWSVRTAWHVAPALFAATVLLTIAVSLVPSAQTVFVAHMINAVSARDMASAFTWALIAGLCIAGYLAAQSIAYTLQRVLQINVRAHCAARINDAMARLDPGAIGDERIAIRARTARSAVEEQKVEQQSVAVLSLVSALTVCMSLLAVIGRVNMWAAVFVVLSMVPQTVSIMLYARYDAVQWPKEADARRHAEYCENQLQYSVPACELATFDAQPRMAKLANGHQRRLAKLCTSVEYRSIRFDAITGLVSLMLLVAALLSLIFADVQPSTLAGGLVGIFSGIIATNGVGYMTGSLISSSVAVQFYIAFVDGSPASATSADSCERATESRDAKLSVATLQLSHIAVTYPNAAAPTVSDMSLEARRGEMIAIVGANGAGKTTTIQGMLGMLPIVSGAMLVDGEHREAEAFHARHRYFGLLTQNYGRYELSVRDNLLIGAGAERDDGLCGCGEARADDDTLWQALRVARADGIVKRLGNGLDTQLGEQWGGIGLSGGEWQRLALARLVLRDAPIWVLDEPTSNIDAQTEAEIFDDLRREADDRIIIVVSHRAWTLRGMDRIYVLDHGRTVEHGSYAELNCKGTRFSQLFAFQHDEDET